MPILLIVLFLALNLYGCNKIYKDDDIKDSNTTKTSSTDVNPVDRTPKAKVEDTPQQQNKSAQLKQKIVLPKTVFPIHKDDYINMVTERWSLNRLADAKRLMDSALVTFPVDVDILTNAALSIIYLNDANGGALAPYQEAKKLADQAISIAPNKSACYVCRIVALGNILSKTGSLEAIGLIVQVKTDFESAVKYNNAPPASMAAAYFVFGTLNTELSKISPIVRFPLGLSWASPESSLELFKKGLSFNNQSVFGNLGYGKALLLANKTEEGKVALERAISLRNSIPNDNKRKAEAKKILTELELK